MQLGDIATIRCGLVLARKQSKVPTVYHYPLLNLRSINDNGTINMDSVDVFDATEQLNPEYLTQIDDVIIRLSTPYTAVLIDSGTSGMVISSNFAAVRANKKYILPEYLFWLLNTAKVKKQIFVNTSSNMLGAIKTKYFSEFEVVPLPMEKQECLASFNNLARRESQLLLELATEKEKYYAFIIDKAQKEMRRGKKYDN